MFRLHQVSAPRLTASVCHTAGLADAPSHALPFWTRTFSHCGNDGAQILQATYVKSVLVHQILFSSNCLLCPEGQSR
jgi:hypothetical protein